MYPPGHLAINYLGVRAATRFLGPLPLWPALIAALFPDVVDKVVADFLHWAPYGRNWTHNLTAVALCGLALGGASRSAAVGLSWVIGHLGHLVGDFVFNPWLWPWFDYLWPHESRNIAEGVAMTAVDLFLGRELSPVAAAVWESRRLIVETLFLGSVLASGLSWFPLSTRRWWLVLGLTCWLYIVIEFDLGPFLWTWERYGIG
ncbi:MAG: hypothetical protein Kow0060_06260 [Methylohalobius crimeensis]